MKIVRLHLLREWVSWFLGSLFFLLGIVFLFVLVEDPLQLFPTKTFYFKALLQWAVQYLPWLLPLCCLLASLFTLAFVQKRGEWTAILSNGISATQCLRNIFLFGVLISIFCSWLGSRDFFQVQDNMFTRNLSLKMTIGKDRVWYFKEFNSSSMTGSLVQLFCYGKRGEDLMRIRAKKATWSPGTGWTFKDGRMLGFYGMNGLPVLSPEGKIIFEKTGKKDTALNESLFSNSPGFNKSFNSLEIDTIRDDPRPHLLLVKKPRDLSVGELNRVLVDYPDRSDIRLAPYQLHKAHLWGTGPACLIGLLVGLVLGASRFSSSPGKIGGIALVASIAYYSIRVLFDSLGEEKIMMPELAALTPYFVTLVALFIFSFWEHRS